MKKRAFISAMFLLMTKLASAYIDPGTGGYLVTSIWPTIVAAVTILLASIGAFFSKYFIHPVKKFVKKHKKKIVYLLFIILILGISFLIYHFFFTKPVFDESLSGAHFYNSSRVLPGYNLYEGKLIDMNGNLINNWSSIYLGVLDSEGNYYAQQYYESLIWGKYGWNGSVIWEKEIPIHHEIILNENSVLTLTKKAVEYNGRKVEFDVILEFDKNGTFKSSFSLWDNLKMFQQFHKPLELDSPVGTKINEDNKKNESIWGGEYDYYHMNAMSFLPSNTLENLTVNNSQNKPIKPFQKGNWMISFRHGSMIYILDKDTKQVVWFVNQFSIQDEIQGQHSPSMLPNGKIIMFDNGRYREWSRVLVINPLTLKVEWEYKEKGFYSLSQSYVQVLPNFNLLVTEAEEGRVFELTPDKKVVWEFYNPERQNTNNSVVEDNFGKRQEIYRMTWYNQSFIDSLLKK
jgi:hypothetical protein